jgi:NADPH:quinone reductase-like Zn-dependent oxidoreductase
MMQRWELPAFGRDNLVLTSALRPKPDPKEVLVKVEAVSLNYRDLLILENGLGGGYDLPLLPGSDFAGTVIEVGEHHIGSLQTYINFRFVRCPQIV